MITSLILLVVGFVLLVRGADAFVDAAASVARRFNIPAIVIGTTLVAIGTSAPEAAISIAAALKGSDGVSIGNVIGSNIANIFRNRGGIRKTIDRPSAFLGKKRLSKEAIILTPWEAGPL